MKKRVLFVGPKPRGADTVWGGSIATAHNFLTSMRLSSRFEIVHIDRNDIKKPEQIPAILERTKYDLLHIDDAGQTAQRFFLAGIQPDVIGPVTRAPNGVKTYNINGSPWDSIYTPDWFYKAVVIRLNANEERHKDFHDRYRTISQGVDTDLLKPNQKPDARLVLWAGDAQRPAKNYPLMQEIMAITTLPAPYEFKVMSGYNVEDYWKALDDAVLLVNTSKYESFCAALFEAKAKGIPTIYREKLHNDRFPDGRIQVPYTAEAYRDAILAILNDPQAMGREGRMNREYCEEFASFDVMKDTYEAAYDEALERKSAR